VEAKDIVRSALNEAYTGPVAAVLNKYHLLDEKGELRNVTIGADPENNKPGEYGPIIDPSVLDRFLEVDQSNKKRVFDWMLYAAAGGAAHLRESEGALAEAKRFVIDKRMKGEGGDGPITPMSREDAEKDWQQNTYPLFYNAYFFADQDLAGDIKFPCFGWFRKWPGRNGVYPKVVDTVSKWVKLTKDKKFIQQWNRLYPKEPFPLSLWDDEKPRYVGVDDLANFVNSAVNNLRATLARMRAEQNVVTVGKNPEGGYRTGPSEVLYDDEHLSVVIPLTAAASLKRGFNNWCIANRSRWEEYFRTKSPHSLLWGGSEYTAKGPFAFITFKKQLPDPEFYALTGVPRLPERPPLAMVAMHAHLTQMPNSPGRFVFWDMQNERAIPHQEMSRRVRAVVPEAVASFNSAAKEVEDWLTQFQQDQLERFPALEAMARALVNAILED